MEQTEALCTRLERSISEKTATIAIVGLGYVGLPVACLFAEAGFQVVGLDRVGARVEEIGRGSCPIDGKEPGLSALLSRAVANGRLRVTTDYDACDDAQVILIAVETPVESQTHKPRYAALRSVLRELGPHLAQGPMVIVESTLAPGTMSGLVRPELEGSSGKREGIDFVLLHCPERVMPGRLLRNVRTMPRVVGGMSTAAAKAGIVLYRNIVEADLDPVDCLTAEIVKTAENTYRDVQIAFANELALICESLGADVWQARELVNKCPGRNVLLPGAGVGGHCIPKDPWLLIANTDAFFEARLVPTARVVNEAMPYHMADLVGDALAEAGVPLRGARVAVLGYAYLENTDDARNTPTEPMAQRLRDLGAEVTIHDPYVHAYVRPIEEVVKGADGLVLMVKHDAYLQLDMDQIRVWMRTPVVVDGRHILTERQIGSGGFIYRGIGRGRAPSG